MVRIAICDDDKNVTRGIYKYLMQKSQQLQEAKLSISIYHSGEDFLQAVAANEIFDIVFLDIQMGGMNGIDVGRVLRNAPDGDSIILIYISSHNSYYEGISRIGVFRFIKKPIRPDELDDVFNRAMTILMKNRATRPKPFQYKINTEIYSVTINRIVYLKNSGRLIEIYAWDEATKAVFSLDKFYSSIDETLRQLPTEQFVQCARSIVVNLDHVQQVGNTVLVLADKEKTEIPIGKTYKEPVKEIYFRRKGGPL